MKNILITENQLRLITEALGVPDSLLVIAEEVFVMVALHLKSITEKEDEYVFHNYPNYELGGKKKIKIEEIETTVNIEHFPQHTGKPEVMSMGMGQSFNFDRDVKFKKVVPSVTAELSITFGVGDEWEPEDLYREFVKEKEKYLPSIAHELKHKYDKQVKKLDLIGRDAEYQTTQRYGNFGIPAIDHKFMRYLYYAHMTENLVRPVEVASDMKLGNVTKSQFYQFLTNNRVYQELQEIKNFTFEDFIRMISESMDRVDALLEHVGEDASNMSDSEKIRRVLELVYINLVNNKMQIFMDMTSDRGEELRNELLKMMGRKVDHTDGEIGDVRQKFFNYITKFKDKPIEFFKSEIENLSYTANKILKRISKLYAMAQDDVQVSESIINWELHQQLMEKKFGKRKIETEYKFKK
jgi:hypothetical protein